MVATELAITGYKVVGIEKGPYWDYADDFAPTKYDEWGVGYDAQVRPPALALVVHLRNNSDQFALPSRRYTYRQAFTRSGHGVGGVAQHYGGSMGGTAMDLYRCTRRQ